MVCANILPVQLHEWTKYQSRGKPCKNLFKESAHQKSSSYKGGGKTHSVPPLLFSTQLTESNGSANDTQQPFRSFLSAFEQATVSTNQHNPTQKPTRTPTPIHTTHVPAKVFVIDDVRHTIARQRRRRTTNDTQQRTSDDERRRTTTMTTNDNDGHRHCQLRSFLPHCPPPTNSHNRTLRLCVRGRSAVSARLYFTPQEW